MLKRLTLTGSTLRGRRIAEKAAIAAAVEARIWPLIEAGRIKAVVDTVLPLAEAAKAHALMEADTHIGKIILSV